MRLKTELIQGIFIVTFEGERLDAPQAESFLSAMQGFIKEGNVFILLDMSNIIFMDSTGLGSMIRALKEIYDDGQLIICGITEQVRSLLKITHLDEVFTIAENRDDAFAIFSVFIAPIPQEPAKEQLQPTNNDTVIDTDFYDRFIHQDDTEPKEEPKERRRYKRIPKDHIVDEDLFAYCQDLNSGKRSHGVIRNISPGGFLMVSNTSHRVDDRMHVQLSVGKAFKLSETAIVRSATDGRYGMEFMGISAKSKSFLTQLGGSIQLNNLSS